MYDLAKDETGRIAPRPQLLDVVEPVLFGTEQIAVDPRVGEMRDPIRAAPLFLFRQKPIDHRTAPPLVSGTTTGSTRSMLTYLPSGEGLVMTRHGTRRATPSSIRSAILGNPAFRIASASGLLFP